MGFLRECFDRLRAAATRIGLKLNEKKTKITKLTRPFTFLKMRFQISESGAVVRRLGKRSIVTMRRKLKKFHKWLVAGKMKLADILQSYQSWRGHAKRARTHDTRKAMDQYFANLFGRENLCLLS